MGVRSFGININLAFHKTYLEVHADFSSYTSSFTILAVPPMAVSEISFKSGSATKALVEDT